MQQVSNPQPRNILLSLVPGRACAHAAGERRVPLVCTHAHVPTVRSGAETAEGGAPAIPTLVGSDKKTTYNADNNNNAAPGTWAVLRCTYIARPPSLARRRSYWLYTAVVPGANCCSSNVPGTTYCFCNVPGTTAVTYRVPVFVGALYTRYSTF